MYSAPYDTGARNVRSYAPYDVIPMDDPLPQHREVNVSNNQSGNLYGGNATNGRPSESRCTNNITTSYNSKQTNHRPPVFSGMNKTGERICLYSNTNRTSYISQHADHTKSPLGVTKTRSNQQLHAQRPWVSARGIRRSSLGDQGRGTLLKGTTQSNDAKPKRSETMKATTAPTLVRTQRKALKRPSVVATESTYLNLAVVVTVFFNIPIGLLAVAIAMQSAKAYRNHRIQQGRRYATLALVVSMIGVVTTVAAVMAAVQYVTSKTDDIT